MVPNLVIILILQGKLGSPFPGGEGIVHFLNLDNGSQSWGCRRPAGSHNALGAVGCCVHSRYPTVIKIIIQHNDL